MIDEIKPCCSSTTWFVITFFANDGEIILGNL